MGLDLLEHMQSTQAEDVHETLECYNGAAEQHRSRETIDVQALLQAWCR